jgi:hypothetical protein
LNQFAHKLRWIAWFDLCVTALFALPFVAMLVIGMLLKLEATLFGPARAVVVPDAPWSIFISIMGVLGVMWAIARLVVEDDRLCLIDAVARLFVAALIGYGLIALSLPLVFAFFILSEVVGALVTWLQKRRA